MKKRIGHEIMYAAPQAQQPLQEQTQPVQEQGAKAEQTPPVPQAAVQPAQESVQHVVQPPAAVQA
jgi:hypothetical protein